MLTKPFLSNRKLKPPVRVYRPSMIATAVMCLDDDEDSSNQDGKPVRATVRKVECRS